LCTVAVIAARITRLTTRIHRPRDRTIRFGARIYHPCRKGKESTHGRRVAESNLAGRDPRSNRKSYDHIMACRMTALQRIRSPRICFRESRITRGSYQIESGQPRNWDVPQKSRRTGTDIATILGRKGGEGECGHPIAVPCCLPAGSVASC
jgi:hypothetical protein